MGYTERAGLRGVERFMKHYFLVAKDVGDLTRIFCAVLETDQQRKRRVSWLRWGPHDLWRRRSLGGFTVEGERLFLEILTSKKNPEIALRRMNEAGVFGKFVPAFGRVVAQMQYDMYHVYTVDEHTLFAIGILHQIETGKLKDELPVASAIMPTVTSRRALYVP